MILTQGTNPNISSFILQTEKLFGFILGRNHDKIEKIKEVQIDAPDLVLNREKYTKEIKEDSRLKEFLEKNPFVNKIKSGQGITSSELKQLETQLAELRPEMTIESIQKYQKKDFVV